MFKRVVTSESELRQLMGTPSERAVKKESANVDEHGRDDELLTTLSAQGKLPQLAIGVEVEECFFHCPKAFRRSKLWEPASWPDRDALPTMACVLYEKLQPAGKTLEEYLRESEEGLQ